MRARIAYLFFVSMFAAAILPKTAEATCSESAELSAYGDFWIERDGENCDCKFYAQEYSCGASEGYRTQASAELITTLSGDCEKPCEDIDGYDSAVETVLGIYDAENDAYECDESFVDNDQDGFGTCIDEDDEDPRVWVKIDEGETVCDGVDNDSDGTADDGITNCDEDGDHKRFRRTNLLQGDAAGSVNLIEGNFLRSETDTVVQGPYGPIAFTRFYNSKETDDIAFMGPGWTHSFAVYLKAMPSEDGRWQVQTPSGEMQYFRCEDYEGEMPSSLSCVIDDHRPRGNLLRVSSVFYWFPGDGTKWRFDDTPIDGRRTADRHLDSGGRTIVAITDDANGAVQKVESANSSIYLYFTYSGGALDKVHINATSGAEILDFDFVSGLLDQVKFASAIGTIDSDTFVEYTYDATDDIIDEIERSFDASNEVTIADVTYTSGKVTRLQDATKDLSISYVDGDTTTVTYNVWSSGNSSVDFTHNGLWVSARDEALHLGGMSANSVVYNEHGRITCSESDGGSVRKYIFDDGAMVRAETYPKTGSCSSPGTVQKKTWYDWDYNTDNMSWRVDWVRNTSVYSGASDCTGATLPSGCRETAYDYVSSSDDRIQWITTTGTTRLATASTPQQIRKQRFYYFGLDTSVCTSAYSYSALPCRVETQDNSSNVYKRTDYTYIASGATAGLLRSVARHDKTSDPAPLTTTYADHNDFGSPETVTDAAGVEHDYVFNGWNAVTQVTENDVILDDSATPVKEDVVTSYSYNKQRRTDTVTLPKGNKNIYKYFSSGEYGRMKAFATADASSNLLEILRYDFDDFGHRTEEKILDSISGTTPCSDEDCTTYDTRSQRKFDAQGRVLNTYRHASDTSDPPDATSTNTYTNGKLTNAENFSGVDTAYTYDSLGRVSTVTRDDSGIDADTTYTYDVNNRVATVTSPTSVVTTTEYDDFGQLVLRRSENTGDIRFEYDTAGRMTKRRRSSYASAANQTDTCYDVDWLGRQTARDLDCNSSDEFTKYYDGDSMPAGDDCPTNTVQTGRLSYYKESYTHDESSVYFHRVFCYHPGGKLYATYQYDGGSTWDDEEAYGISKVYDDNGNLWKEWVWDRADSRSYAREIEYVYDGTLKDRISYIRHRLSGDSWTNITSDSTSPTYFAFGGFKTISYANGIAETNTVDKARQITERTTADGETTYTEIDLTYDDVGNITLYEDSGKRHLKYYADYDNLNRMRCLSRSSISSCSGSAPWEDAFLESFDYDDSGNRTNRRYGEFATDDEDAYTYVTDSDIIDKVTSGGTDYQMSNTYRGEIDEVNQPDGIDYTWNDEGHLTGSSHDTLGDADHFSTMAFGDRYKKVAPCNSRTNNFYYTGGAVKLMDLYNSCASETPRQLRAFVSIEGRPIAVLHSSHSGSTQTEPTDGDGATYWVHTDHLGTPIMVSDDDGTERWRWENDPFGREKPIEYEVLSSDVNPDDDPAGDASPSDEYNTCCCFDSSCGKSTKGCSAGECDSGASQEEVWEQTYAPEDANNVRVHFSTFDVEEGSDRTDKDYVVLDDGESTIAELTGNLGAHWSIWSGTGSMTVKLVSDYSQAETRGFVIDKLEYTDDTNTQYVLNLRMPGQIWDDDANLSYNYHRWYRSEDGRYSSPDPIGLASGDISYFSYTDSNPLSKIDPSGLIPTSGHNRIAEIARRGRTANITPMSTIYRCFIPGVVLAGLMCTENGTETTAYSRLIRVPWLTSVIQRPTFPAICDALETAYRVSLESSAAEGCIEGEPARRPQYIPQECWEPPVHECRCCPLFNVTHMPGSDSPIQP